jgi:uncharacterized protein YegP (UPF0339 family)
LHPENIMMSLPFRGWLFLGTMIGVLGVARAGAGVSTTEGLQAAPSAQAVPVQSGRALKFETYQDARKEHRWRLKATNGQVIAASGQGYKDKRDRDSAIERIKKDAATKLTFETYQDAKEQYRWRLKATNGQVIAASGQGYKDKRDCDNAIDVIKKGAEKAKVEEAAE